MNGEIAAILPVNDEQDGTRTRRRRIDSDEVVIAGAHSSAMLRLAPLFFLTAVSLRDSDGVVVRRSVHSRFEICGR